MTSAKPTRREWTLERIMGNWYVTRLTQHDHYDGTSTATVREVIPGEITLTRAAPDISAQSNGEK